MFQSFPDPGALPVLIIVAFSAVAKFYFAIRSRSWYSFADGMARLGLCLFYLVAFMATLSGTFARDQDAWRILARYSVMAVFLIEAVPWVISLFRHKAHKL